MGTKRGTLIDFLDFEHAKPFLKDGVTEKDWTPKQVIEEVIKKEILGYLDFAWDKANNCRGLSAGRSVEHIEAWLWLLGDEELEKRFDAVEYEHYGKEKLILISDALGFDWKKVDDGVRTNIG